MAESIARVLRDAFHSFRPVNAGGDGVARSRYEEQCQGGVAQMERYEENDLGWSKTFVNSSIMANFHVAAGRRPRAPGTKNKILGSKTQFWW